MTRTLSLTLVFATFAFAGIVQSTDVRASTADGITPAEETACDGATGVNNGICIAYCEATDCGGGSDDTCMSRCKQTAVRQYEACFPEKIIIPKDRVQKNASGAYELTTSGAKIHGSLAVGESIDCGEDHCVIKERDCATSVDERLKTCFDRC